MAKKKTAKKTMAEKTKDFVETHEFNKNAPDLVKKTDTEVLLVLHQDLHKIVERLSQRIDHIVEAHEKCKSLKGL